MWNTLAELVRFWVEVDLISKSGVLSYVRVKRWNDGRVQDIALRGMNKLSFDLGEWWWWKESVGGYQ
jgi:hypothetical protein